VLVHPNTSTFERFTNLAQNAIINIPSVHFHCVVYSDAHYDSHLLKNYIEENDYKNFSLQEVQGQLNSENLFQKNECSSQFYELFKNSTGIIFLGGDDISPSVYDQKTDLLISTTDVGRHNFELSFLFHLLGGKQDDDFEPFLEEKPDYPVYGFCLGMQTMNIATGGTLYQDIPKDIYQLQYVEDLIELGYEYMHKNYWYNLYPASEILYANFHRIQFVPEKSLLKKMGIDKNIQPRVYSSHHQAVRDLGKGLEVLATSLDGEVVEIITHEKYKNVLGVQFHPEVWYLYDPQGPGYKQTPSDSVTLNYYERLRTDESLDFHIKL
jgi:putative glutamine amidotransferase